MANRRGGHPPLRSGSDLSVDPPACEWLRSAAISSGLARSKYSGIRGFRRTRWPVARPGFRAGPGNGLRPALVDLGSSARSSRHHHSHGRRVACCRSLRGPRTRPPSACRPFAPGPRDETKNRLRGGFTLVEVLVGSAISLAAIAVACLLAAEAQVAWRSASARVDLQQRARVIADLITRLLREAGAGPMGGPARANLIRGIPPVLPRRVGRRGAHAFNEFRTDAFTVIRAIAESEHGALLTPAGFGTATLELSPDLCALTACGLPTAST